jgi:hypothetical protein
LINDKIKDLCISLRAQDYLKLPERIDDIRYITFEGTLAKQYKEFERDMFLRFDEEEIDVASAAALTNKLLQFCNGAVYIEDHSYIEVHDEKLEMLSELLEGLEGKSVLIFYTFQHDLDRIQKLLKSTKLRVGHLKTSEDITKWNNKEMDVLLAHPASAAYGLNLQDGRQSHYMVWP